MSKICYFVLIIKYKGISFLARFNFSFSEFVRIIKTSIKCNLLVFKIKKNFFIFAVKFDKDGT